MDFNNKIERSINELAREINVYDYIERLALDDTNIKDTGENVQLLCPLHNDNTPSFGIRKDNLVSNCFKCGGFNALSLIMEVEKCSYKKALDILKELAGEIEIEYEIEELKKKLENLENGKKKKEEVKNEEIEQLPKGLTSAIGHLYLIKKRGLLNKTIKYFNLKYVKYGKFHHRIIVPIIENNKYRGFLARDTLRFQLSKEEFKKRFPSGRKRVLHAWGMDEDKFLFNYSNIVNKVDKVFLVEGVFDAMKLWQLGLPAAALMGSDLKEGQLELLEDSFDTIILMLDNDDTGFEKTEKIGNQLVNFKTGVAVYKGDDPGVLEDRKDLEKVISLEDWKERESYSYLKSKIRKVMN